jgi:glucose-6-phosphate-specific signal transduction histidine kinase
MPICLVRAFGWQQCISCSSLKSIAVASALQLRVLDDESTIFSVLVCVETYDERIPQHPLSLFFY